MYKRILVPVDGSDTSMLGLQEAIGLARDQGAKLRIINVVDEHLVAQHADLFEFGNHGDLLALLRKSGKKVIEEAIASARKHGVKAEASLSDSLDGNVSEAIVNQARKWRADLIVMGTHGRRGAYRLVLGSDAEAVLHATPVPVLLVRPSEKK
jgi:nucleotide-binding universal stress UspA family protein